MGLGYLTVKTNMANGAVPLPNANITIKDENGRNLYSMKTDESGETKSVMLYAPDKMLTLLPYYDQAPYSVYQVEVQTPGYVSVIIKGVQIFDTIQAIQDVELSPMIEGDRDQVIVITPHEQVLTSPRNGQEQPAIQAMATQGSVENFQAISEPERTLQRVIIPDFITVHLGRFDVDARNIRVPFPVYIKNVASSEIYPTWPVNALEANIRAIINFALNRVYTEWYRSRGYNFDMTGFKKNHMEKSCFLSFFLIVIFQF